MLGKQFAKYILQTVGISSTYDSIIHDNKQTLGIDVHKASGFDVCKVLDFLKTKPDTFFRADVSEAFFIGLTASYLVNDAAFNNVCWGVLNEQLKPVPILLIDPFVRRVPLYSVKGLEPTPYNMLMFYSDNTVYTGLLLKVYKAWKEKESVVGSFIVDAYSQDSFAQVMLFYNTVKENIDNLYKALLQYVFVDDGFITWISDAEPKLSFTLSKAGAAIAILKYGEDKIIQLYENYVESRRM